MAHPTPPSDVQVLFGCECKRRVRLSGHPPGPRISRDLWCRSGGERHNDPTQVAGVVIKNGLGREQYLIPAPHVMGGCWGISCVYKKAHLGLIALLINVSERL